MNIMDDPDGFKLTSKDETTAKISLEITQSSEWKQYLAAFLASLISMGTGCVASWSSPAVPILTSENSQILGGIRKLTEEDVSWISSLINLGAFCGSIPAGSFSFYFGRKTFLLSLAIPLIVGWLLIIYNFGMVWCLYAGRFMCGISYGSLNVALPIYNNEICKDSIRGRIGIFYDLMQCVGVLWLFGFGIFFDLYWTTVFCLAVPVVFFVTFLWMPESPTYLVRNGRKDKAIESLRWLYGTNCNIENELSKIDLALQEGKVTNISESKTSLISSPRSLFHSFSKVTIKAVSIAFFMFVLQRSCGGTMVIYFVEPMLERAKSPIDMRIASLINGIAQLMFSLLTVLFVDSVGRKALLLFTFGIMALSIFIHTIYVELINDGRLYLIESFGWIPLVCLTLFVGMFRFGVSPIPWFMAPEIIPTEAQRWAPSAIVCITWGMSFLISKSFLPALTAFGQIAVYSCFTVICCIGFIFTWLLVPETRNKSREEIQMNLGATKTKSIKL